MHIVEIATILQSITYKPGWEIILDDDSRGVFVQIAATTLDSTGDHRPAPWKSGKRYLSTHMCRQEIVGLVFDLIKAAEMHECAEWFRYKGASIFNPHLDPDVSAEVARKASSFNCRANAMSMEESK